MEFGSIQAFTMQYALMILPTMVDGWTVKEWSRCACMDMGKNQVTVTGTMDANVSSNRVVDRRIGGRIGELGKRSEEQHARGTGVAR